MKKLIAVLAGLALFGGTALAMPGMSQRTGARFDPLPADCPVEFIENTAEADMGSLVVLGSTTIVGVNGFSKKTNKKLQKLTCEWGGTAVSILSSSGAGLTAAATFSIYRKQGPTDGPPPEEFKLACSGTFGNSHGATITIEESGAATMSYGGNAATCEAKALGGQKLSLVCSGRSQGGSFADDCSSASFGGMAYIKQ